MPFDALLAPARPSARPGHLGGLLADLGAAAVPPDVLRSHKQYQLDRFAPSFWHRHNTWLPVGLMGSVGCMALSGGLANGMLPGSLVPSWLSLFWLSVMTLLIVFGVFRVSAGARWDERPVATDALGQLRVPQPVAALARVIQDQVPGSRLILGELLQEEVVLDPYLVAEFGGERVCLGIWDDRRIIAIAG